MKIEIPNKIHMGWFIALAIVTLIFITIGMFVIVSQANELDNKCYKKSPYMQDVDFLFPNIIWVLVVLAILIHGFPSLIRIYNDHSINNEIKGESNEDNEDRESK